MDELKPCPFCGGDGWHDEDGVVVCAGCGAMGPEVNTIDRAENAVAWNRRALTESDQPPAEAIDAALGGQEYPSPEARAAFAAVAEKHMRPVRAESEQPNSEAYRVAWETGYRQGHEDEKAGHWFSREERPSESEQREPVAQVGWDGTRLHGSIGDIPEGSYWLVPIAAPTPEEQEG